MKMRPYQERAVRSIGLMLADNPSTLLTMATGLGKTVCIAHAIREHCKGRAMVLAHREELVNQNARTIGAVLGEPCDIEMADRHADLGGLMDRARVIVASKDSLHERRLARFDPAEFGMVVVDESHRAIAASYTRVIDYFRSAKLLGVTATPNRHDGSALGQVFATSAMIYGIADGIRDGWLVPIIAYSPIVTGLDLDDVRTVAGDLCESELAEKLERDRPVHEICTTSIERCGSRRALGFAASVRQSAMIADAMNHYHPNCARHLSGETPRDERAETLAAHRRGEFQFLWNCGLFLEGYDDPGLGAVIMARPTKSLPLFTQMVGRGTRPLPGTVDADESHAGAADAGWRTGRIADSEKPNLLLLNFTANCSRHKLITPADVLGGAYADEDREAAAAMIGDGETDVGSALERARIAREESGPRALREEFARARARIVASATYLLKEEDLFDSAFTPGRERTWLTGAAPTEKQIATLERHGFAREDVVRLSKNECSKLIGGIAMRVQNGLCTIKQAAHLKRRGHKNADTYTFEQARQALDRLYGARA